MAKYFIHNGEHQTLIDEMPAGWTALAVNSAERNVVIDPLENVDVIGVPSIILEVEGYRRIKTEEKMTYWKCLLVREATSWSDVEDIITNRETLVDEHHAREKTELAAIEAAMI